MTVETSVLEPHDFSRNLSEEMQEVHKKSYHALRYLSYPGSRSQKFEKTPRDTAHNQVPSPEDGKNALVLNASATEPSSSTSVARSISNQSIVETQIATTPDTAGNNSSKDLKRSSLRNGVSDEANNQEETQECQRCRVKFKAEKTMTTTEEFLFGGQYCNACQKEIGGAEPSSDSGRPIKKEEESSPRLKKQKQETTNKKKTWKKWL